MAITVHYIKEGEFTPKNGLLATERFMGSHTGECIAAAFDSVVDEYELRHKIDHIVTGNAANMRKAFTVRFPHAEDDQVDESDGQRWSPRGHGLGLEAPRGQLVMSLALALASDVVSLALALASENMYLVLIIFALCA